MRYVDIMNRFIISSKDENGYKTYAARVITEKEYRIIHRALKTMDAIEYVIDEELGIK